jgi:hypothetical protein
VTDRDGSAQIIRSAYDDMAIAPGGALLLTVVAPQDRAAVTAAHDA